MHRGVILTAVLVCLGVAGICSAQEQATTTSTELTIGAVQQLQRELEQNASETNKEQIGRHYEAAIANLELAEELGERATLASSRTSAAPAELEALRAAQPATGRELPNGQPDLTVLRAELTNLETELGSLRRSATSMRDERARREAREREISDLRPGVERELAEVRDRITQVSSAEEVSSVDQALLVELQSKRMQLGAQLEVFAAELAQYQAERELLSARLDSERERESALDTFVTEYRALVSQRQEAQAAEQQAQAARQAALSRDEVRSIAEQNQTLAEERSAEGFPALINELRAESASFTSEFEENETQMGYIEGQTQVGAPVGLELQHELQKLRSKLRNPWDLERDIGSTKSEIRRVTGLKYRLERQRDELADLNSRVAAELAAIGNVSPSDRSAIEGELIELLKSRREYLDAYISECGQYLDALRDHKNELEQLTAQNERMGSFLQSKGLLMRSAELPSLDDVERSKKALHWLFDWEVFQQNLEAAKQSVSKHPLVTLLLTIFLIALIPLRIVMQRAFAQTDGKKFTPSFWAMIHAAALTVFMVWIVLGNWQTLEDCVRAYPLRSALLGGGAVLLLLFRAIVSPVILPTLSPQRKGGTKDDRIKRALTFRPTLWAVFHTLMLSTYYAWILWAVGWMLTWAPDAPEYSEALGFGLQRAAYVFFLLNAIRQLCQIDGLADEHFEWPEATVMHIRSHLNWFILLGTGLWFVMAVLDRHGDVAFTGSLGRGSYILLNVLTAILTWRVFRVGNGRNAMQQIMNRSGSKFVRKLRPMWYLLGIVVPLALALTSILGWHYTSQVVATASWLFIFFVIGAVCFFAILERGWTVLKRREKYEEAMRKREAKMSDADDSEEEFEFKPDLNLIGEHGQRLLRWALLVSIGFGFFFTWGQVFPAFEALDQVELPLSRVEQVVTPEGGSAQVDVALTLADVLSYLMRLVTVVLIFYPLVRYLPGFLEITALKALKGSSAGVRHAYAKLSQYLMVVLAFISIRMALDISWAWIGVLAAPAGLALALSSQKLFGDIVGGIRLYLTRPIRVGDVVKIDGIAGIVRKIEFDRTTIETWSQSEFLITNANVVNSNIENFTRSNSMNRHSFTVGVQYDDDDAAGIMEKAEEALRAAAASVEGVRTDDEKPPFAMFGDFGDNSINYTLYVYALDRSNWGHIRNEVPKAIMREFKARGLTVPFPQRDIHLDSQVLDLLGRTAA